MCISMYWCCFLLMHTQFLFLLNCVQFVGNFFGGESAEKCFILHPFILKRGLTDNNWRKGLLLNVFQTAGWLMESERLIKLAAGWQIYTMYMSRTNSIKCTQDDIRAILGHFFLSSFCGPFLWDDPLIFTPSEAENHTETNNCTGCVNTEYRGDGKGLTFTFLSFFCMEAINFISITN